MNTFISILFLHQESSRQRYLDSHLQDNSGDMQYFTSNPVHRNSIFPHFVMVITCVVGRVVVCGLWFCGGVLVR
jgi:hypothetical protein